MRILVAEDDLYQREYVQALLTEWGYEVLAVEDGNRALEMLSNPDAPSIALLDSLMPGLDGPELCRRLRRRSGALPLHIILLTGRRSPEDIRAGLEAGADDYVGKPFNDQELRARLRAGERVVRLQQALSDRVRELEGALARVNELEGLLPICSYCKKVRNGADYWQQVEVYIAERSRARFSHGICPECYPSVVREAESQT